MNVFRKASAIVTLLGLFSVPAAMATVASALEDQPHMQEALLALQQARHHLEAAIPDKDGQRSAAIKACDEAIRHTQAGIQYWKEHP